MRILVTGSREWADATAIRSALAEAGRAAGVHPRDVVVVHGAARGADSLADRVARDLGCRVEAHRVDDADWRRYGRSAGHRRNADMVRLGADLCLAFPIGESKGTRGCIAMAQAAGIPVVVTEGAVTECGG